MTDLDGKTALITGAGTGIGRRFAEHLGRCGASVLVADLRGADAAAAELRTAGLQAEGDVPSETDAGRMANYPGDSANGSVWPGAD